MEKIDVLVLAQIRPEQMQMLEARYQLHRYDLANAKERTEMLARHGERIRAVLTTYDGGFEKELLDQLPNLEIVACSSVGFDSLCVDDCLARGIPVTNTPDVLTDDVADLGMLLLLATVRRLLPGADWIKSGKWVEQGMMPLSTSLKGKTLGIVGLGRIGKAFARRAELSGMNISYYGRRQQTDVSYRYYSDLEALAQDVDVLAPVVPGGAETQGMISREVLKALGPEGYFINIARGSVVDEQALIDLLQSGALAGAGLDVFADEPNVPQALIEMDNVVLQPHLGSATVETRGAMAQLAVDNLAAHFEGRPLLTPVRR